MLRSTNENDHINNGTPDAVVWKEATDDDWDDDDWGNEEDEWDEEWDEEDDWDDESDDLNVEDKE